MQKRLSEDISKRKINREIENNYKEELYRKMTQYSNKKSGDTQVTPSKPRTRDNVIDLTRSNDEIISIEKICPIYSNEGLSEEHIAFHNVKRKLDY
jgi:hypothetical protein